MSDFNEIIKNLTLELRKGTLVLAVLSQLNQKHYGYSLVETLNGHGLKIDQNTLYPLLRRLDKQGLLDATWDVSETRPRKYYQLSDLGVKVYLELQKTYVKNHQVLMNMMEEE